MKKLTIITQLFLLVTMSIYAQDQGSEAWRSDLDYLVQRIEIMHPDPYAFFAKKEFYKLKQELKYD